MNRHFTDLWTDFSDTVAQVANEWGRKGYRYGAEAGDFGNEFAIWMMENATTLQQQRELLGDEAFAKYLARCLRNEGSDYLLDIKAQSLGYQRDDVYFYSKGELKVLLDAMFDRDAWLNPPQSEGRSTKRPAEGNNWVATLADVAQAFEKLTTDDQELLRDFHEREWTNRELAKLNGVTDQVMSYRHGAAVGRLQRHLGGPAPYPMRESDGDPVWRGRRAISNAAARAATANTYEEA